MDSADTRVEALLDRWLASVELHARYLSLDDAAYAKVQDWPAHARPTKWVVDLARTRLLELKKLLAERQAAGDAGFAEALELMGLLTNLLGSEHVERFIPLAQPAGAAPDSAATVPASPAKVTAEAPPHGQAEAGPGTGPDRQGADPPAISATAGAPRGSRGQGDRHRHRRRRPAAELGSRMAAAREPDRAARRPAAEAEVWKILRAAPRRDRRAGDAGPASDRPRGVASLRKLAVIASARSRAPSPGVPPHAADPRPAPRRSRPAARLRLRNGAQAQGALEGRAGAQVPQGGLPERSPGISGPMGAMAQGKAPFDAAEFDMRAGTRRRAHADARRVLLGRNRRASPARRPRPSCGATAPTSTRR